MADFAGALETASGRKPDWSHGEDLVKAFGPGIWKYTNTHEFWANLPLLPWAKRLLGLVAERKPMFLTVPSRSPLCASGKASWLARHFPGVPYAITTDKSVFAMGNTLIDDRESILQRWTHAGGRAVLFPAPYNELRAHALDPLGYLFPATPVGSLEKRS